jgi:RimJ/RimL family protein N-acetyltransferase
MSERISGGPRTEIRIEIRTEIETERLILRRWREADREPFRRINADPRVMEHMPGPLAPEQSDGLIDRIEQHFERHGFGLFAAQLSGVQPRGQDEAIGFIGLSVPAYDAPFMPAVEIGWRLAFDAWGKGLATEGARAAVRFGFETIGLDEIVSFTVPANVRSRRVMEKLGMTHDPADDFDHPVLPVGHPLRRHVLYRPRRA